MLASTSKLEADVTFIQKISFMFLHYFNYIYSVYDKYNFVQVTLIINNIVFTPDYHLQFQWKLT